MDGAKVFAGLTGGIASGKTLVSNELFRLGATIIDADVLSRKVIEKDTPGEQMLRQAFPFAYFNGVIDRCKLRDAVFEDNAMLQKLNSIMHPLIKDEALWLYEQSKNEVVVLVAPLLFESGFNLLTSPNITVSSSENLRIERLMQRDNITKQLAKKIIDSQLTDAKREAAADIVLRNDSGTDNLLEKAKVLYNMLKQIANCGE